MEARIERLEEEVVSLGDRIDNLVDCFKSLMQEVRDGRYVCEEAVRVLGGETEDTKLAIQVLARKSVFHDEHKK